MYAKLLHLVAFTLLVTGCGCLGKGLRELGSIPQVTQPFTLCDELTPVWLAPSAIDIPERREAALEALAIWEAALQRDLWRLVDTQEEAVIAIRVGGDRPGKCGLCKWWYVVDDGKPCASKIEIYTHSNCATGDRLTTVWVHELGHALGLKDHMVKGGAMYFTTGPLHLPWEHPVYPAVEEVQLLNTLYEKD